MAAPNTFPTPPQEEVDDIILSARFGELEEVEAFATKYGWEALAAAKDDRGNTVLHMISANGHLDVLQAILPNLPASLLAQTNEAGSPPIHWAVLNNHTVIVQALVDVPEERGGGIQLLKQKNAAGRDAHAEAVFAGEGKEEVAGWIEGYIWKIEGGDDEVPEDSADAADDSAADVTTEVSLKLEDGKVTTSVRQVDDAELAEKAAGLEVKA